MATTTSTTKTLKAQTQQPNGTGKTSSPPSQTLYLKNLPTSKISKDDVKRALYCLFSSYGPVLDVVVMRANGKKRGFAHVVFRDVQASTQAMRALQDFDFLGRELNIEYARGKSGIISRLDGTVKETQPKVPQPAAPAMTETQQSVFNNPNAQLPPKPSASTDAVMTDGDKAPQGTKRPREEEAEDDDDEGAPMEEDSDEAAMEESDDD